MKVYTDGCKNKNGSGWAVICPERKQILRGNLNGATNQQAELGAIIQALHYYGSTIEIFTDSKYAIGCFTEWYPRWLQNGWKNSQNKPVENQPLITVGLQKGANLVKYTHIRGHSGDQFNE